jgi:class 3 adenylate cyclase/tetratricopeptide (TPR) repeat protein
MRGSGAICSSCGRDGGPGHFCEACGAPLPESCPSCGAAVSAAARFCGACGFRLEQGREPVAEGERRQLAALFFDVVDSTALAQRLDVEEFGELMLAVQQLATTTITELGGTVGTYAGDGLLAWFGWPLAHEDDTALAVQAGLEILRKLDEQGAATERARGVRLTARVAVHVGPVVVRTDRRDIPAFGDTLHVAARLQTIADAGTVVISEVAQRLVSRRFETAPLGRHTLKGVREPIAAYRVRSARGGDEPLPAAAYDAPLVGRARELGQLLEAWSTTKRGFGRAAVICGEPGVGKSRLLTTLRDSLRPEPHRWLELRCSPLGVNTAFGPVVGMIRRELGIRISDCAEDQRRKIGRALSGSHGDAVAGLLGLAVEDLPAPEKFRHDLMEALHSWLMALACASPVVLAGEDLHWSDPSTLELIRLLRDRLGSAAVLIVVTHRAEAALDLRPHVAIMLERLGREDARTLARHLASSQGLAPAVAERVVERSDGVPLFIEELVAAAAGNDDGSGLPTSLQSSLLARLDRLGAARDVAQTAAVLGRSFPEQLLVAAAGKPPNQLADALRQLIAAGLIESSPSIDGMRYQFRHALIRDAAYASLLKPRRAQLHLQVARVLEEQFAERVARDPELLGHHLERGREPLRAAHCLERAGRRAAGTAALAEAAAHYRRGIELLGPLPESNERGRQEMWLQILLGNALMGLEGHGADSLRPVWQRAIELGERVGDADELTAALNGLAVQEVDNANLDAAITLARRQLEIADETGSPFARLRGHGTTGLALFYRGHGRLALQHFTESLACYQRGDFQTVTFGVGHDQGIFAQAMSSWALWWLGKPDSALEASHQAVAEAEELGSFLTLAMARHFLAMVYQLRRESEAALEQAQINVEFAHELGFQFWEGVALLTAGAERTRMGDTGGLGEIGRGLGLLSDASSRSGTASGLATLAEAQRAAGDVPSALATVDAALKLSRERAQPYWDAELTRLKAELLALQRAPRGRVDALLSAALRDATERGAAALALRAATSLGRRLVEEERGAEARDLLAPALAAIEGGEDTADVRDAQALLDGLPVTTLQAEELR